MTKRISNFLYSFVLIKQEIADKIVVYFHAEKVMKNGLFNSPNLSAI